MYIDMYDWLLLQLWLLKLDIKLFLFRRKKMCLKSDKS